MSANARHQIENLTAQRKNLGRELKQVRAGYAELVKKEEEGERVRQLLLGQIEKIEKSYHEAQDQNLDLRTKYYSAPYWFIGILLGSHVLVGLGWIFLL